MNLRNIMEAETILKNREVEAVQCAPNREVFTLENEFTSVKKRLQNTPLPSLVTVPDTC